MSNGCAEASVDSFFVQAMSVQFRVKHHTSNVRESKEEYIYKKIILSDDRKVFRTKRQKIIDMIKLLGDSKLIIMWMFLRIHLMIRCDYDTTWTDTIPIS